VAPSRARLVAMVKACHLCGASSLVSCGCKDYRHRSRQMSPNQKQSTPKRVWYASYGSNLKRKRFMCYIKGGTPEGSAKRNEGCRDKSEPTESRPISLNFTLYF